MRTWLLGGVVICLVGFGVAVFFLTRPSSNQILAPQEESGETQETSEQEGVPERLPRTPDPAQPVPPEAKPGREDVFEPGPVSPEDPALTVGGRVTDEQGAPVPDILVACLARPDRRARSALSSALRRLGLGKISPLPGGKTDKDGRFEFKVTDHGPLFLLANPPGFLEAVLEIEDLRNLDAPAVLVLQRGLSVSGRILLESLGDPVPGVQLMGFQQTKGEVVRSRVRKAKTGADGSFSLGGFGPGKVTLQLQIPKEAPYRSMKCPSPDAGSTGVEIKVVSVGTVAFEAVEKGTGNPIVFPIRARVKGNKYPYAIRVSREGPGRYALLCPGGEREVIFESQGLKPVTVEFFIEIGIRKERPEPIVFTKEIALEGALTFAQDPKTPKLHPNVEAGRVFYERLDGKDEEIKVWRVARTGDATGQYRIPSPPPGRYGLVAIAPAYRPARAEVSVGEKGAVFDFTLDLRLPTDPRPKPRFSYKERKNLKISFDIQDISVHETLDWLVAVTGADLRMRKGSESTKTRLQMCMDGIPLSQALQLILMMNNYGIDEETGEVFAN